MVSKYLMKKHFRQNANAKYEKQENGNSFLYGFRFSQIIIEALFKEALLILKTKVCFAALLQYY